MSPDPAGMAAVDPGNPQTWNRYAYVENNPLAYVDPDGTSDDDHWAALYGWGSHAGSGSLEGSMIAAVAGVEQGTGPSTLLGGWAAAGESQYIRDNCIGCVTFQGRLYGKYYDQTFGSWEPYASWRTAIAAMPQSQAYSAFMAACLYLIGCNPSMVYGVTSQRRGTTENIQVIGANGSPLSLDVATAANDASHTGYGHGGNSSWYIGGQLNTLHVVDVSNPYAAAVPGGEAHIDPFSPYGIGVPLHGIEYLLSIFVPNSAVRTFSCSGAGCY